jgi:predicted nuclease of restriction endonuclease-like RecB superfamily
VLSRAHVAPFIRRERGTIRVAYLADPDGRVAVLLDRFCRLVRRLEGRPRATVIEALRRQERRVRDAARLSGIAKTLLDLSDFVAPDEAGLAPDVRDAVFRARGRRWPPIPGDHYAPYVDAATALGRPVEDVRHLLYADAPGARVLRLAPPLDGRALLARYNLELARAVLRDAERLTLTARGGWRAIFRALKAARAMYTVRRKGRSYQVEVTGPAAEFIVRPARYGVRLARVVPALMRAPAWRFDADVRGVEGALLSFSARGQPRAPVTKAPVGEAARRPVYDSAWERSLASDFRRRFGGDARGGWTLTRESSPVARGNELFLPDFTLRHDDGREALVELVGFWTPEYLAEKTRKIAAARLGNLILVVYRGLAVGKGAAELESLVEAERIVWFTTQPRAAEVVKVAEQWAVRSALGSVPGVRGQGSGPGVRHQDTEDSPDA